MAYSFELALQIFGEMNPAERAACLDAMNFMVVNMGKINETPHYYALLAEHPTDAKIDINDNGVWSLSLQMPFGGRLFAVEINPTVPDEKPKKKVPVKSVELVSEDVLDNLIRRKPRNEL